MWNFLSCSRLFTSFQIHCGYVIFFCFFNFLCVLHVHASIWVVFLNLVRFLWVFVHDLFCELFVHDLCFRFCGFLVHNLCSWFLMWILRVFFHDFFVGFLFMILFMIFDVDFVVFVHDFFVHWFFSSFCFSFLFLYCLFFLFDLGSFVHV